LTVIVRDAGSGKWRLFEQPLEIVTARHIEEVLPALQKIENECTHHQRYAAGFLSYEAAPAFDAALKTQAPGDFPLLWFAVYDTAHERSLDELGSLAQARDRSLGPASSSPATAAADHQWIPSISAERYAEVVEQLQELIRNGDTYQVNYTYRIRTRLQSDPLAFFLQLARTQSPPFGAYVDTGEWAICSASPELFFHHAAPRIESRPMKGTAARGLWFEQDIENGRRLRESAKEQAENVMIVDMVRNDLGRVARPGTVRVTNLFDVERHPTVLQLTSTVAAETDASLVELMRALFPAASITGAPKARTMEIIAGVECTPRRIYTGTIGFLEPGGRSQFNVAIRTVLVNRATGEAEYGIGGGIVADSNVTDEWNESQIKARALASRPPSFELLETMLWKPDAGYVLLGRHLKRLLQSSDYFGFQVDVLDVRDRLERYAMSLTPTPHRVRLTVSRRGAVDISSTPLDVRRGAARGGRGPQRGSRVGVPDGAPQAERRERGEGPPRLNNDAGFPTIALAASPIDPANPFLYHKTTNRAIYEAAIAARPGFRDVLLYNDRGEVTESTIATLVVEIDGDLVTPAIACGLLPGTLRAHLIDEGKIREQLITVQQMLSASARYLMNSVRGFHPIELVTDP
jgi:para-aminobenzoate synthetase/4-amino-4-deoxychorismate lyase